MNSNDEKQEEKVPSIKSILKGWNKDLRNGSFNTHGGVYFLVTYLIIVSTK